MFVHFPKSLRARGFKKPTDVRPIVRYGSGSPQGSGAGRRRQGTVRKYFIDSTDIVAAATTPGCAIEITGNQINVLRDHKSTNTLDNFLGTTSFPGMNIADVQRSYGEDFLTTGCSTTKRST